MKQIIDYDKIDGLRALIEASTVDLALCEGIDRDERNLKVGVKVWVWRSHTQLQTYYIFGYDSKAVKDGFEAVTTYSCGERKMCQIGSASYEELFGESIAFEVIKKRKRKTAASALKKAYRKCREYNSRFEEEEEEEPLIWMEAETADDELLMEY